MAELPNPHSIAIGTLIALYSDTNSPLFQSSSSRASSATSLWPLELSRLIQQLVMREEEDGLFALLDDGGGGGNDDDVIGNNPALSGDNNDDYDNDGNEKDPIDVIDFFDRHHHNEKLDFHSLTDDFLNDLLLLGDDGSSTGGSETEKQCGVTKEKKKTTRFHDGSGIRSSSSSSSPFRLQTLSSLLDSIDDAFYNHHLLSNNENNNDIINSTTTTTTASTTTRRKRRSPPSKALLSKLQIASSSIDNLMNQLDEWHALLDGTYTSTFTTNNKTAVAAVAIDGESTFGIHIRKLCLGMEEIPFEALSRLWVALRNEVTPIAAAVDAEEEEETTNNNNDSSSNDNIQNMNNTTTATSTTTTTWLPSTPQIERLLRRTCLHPNLESHFLRRSLHRHNNDNHNDNATTTTNNIISIMEELQQTHPECPSISFLAFLSSLVSGERQLALESLHRYFDYAMIHERKERAERAVMLQLLGVSGGGGNNNADGMMRTAAAAATTTATSGMGGITTMTSGMGGITGGMTGGVMHGMLSASVGGGGGGGRSGSSGGVGGSGGGGGTDAKIYKESNVMEYAAVLLAQMHYRFGFSRLALQATEEAVRVAQQSGDDECVSFANGWLALASSSIGVGGRRRRVKESIYATVGGLLLPDVRSQVVQQSRGYRPLVPGIGGGNCSIGRSTLEEEAMLQHCQTRAIQRGLAALSVGTSLELARRTVYRRGGGDAGQQLLLCSNNNNELLGGGGGGGGGGLDPSSSLAWDGIQRSGTAGSSTSSFVDNRPSARLLSNHHRERSDGATALSQIHSDVGNMTASDAIGILGRQALAESGLWDSTGHSSLASLSSCRAMYGFRSNEALRRVLSSFSHGPGKEEGRNEGGGLYLTTLERFASMSDMAAVPSTPEWILSASAFLHEWLTRSYDVSVARNLQCIIASHAAFPFNSLTPVETYLMLLTKSTHLSLQQEDYERAKASARQACWFASRHALFFHQGWHLLQLALIDLEASVSAPSNFESSLTPLLECLHLSEQYVMDPLRAAALMCLGRVFLSMGRICKARALLNAAVPLLMQHGHVWFQAEACLTLAKCHLAEVSSIKEKIDTSSSALQLRRNAVVHLEKAASLFEKIEDIHRLKQVYYLQARVHQFLPSDQRKRDEAANNFLKFNKMKQHKLTGRKQWDALHGVLITNVKEMLKSRVR